MSAQEWRITREVFKSEFWMYSKRWCNFLFRSFHPDPMLLSRLWKNILKNKNFYFIFLFFIPFYKGRIVPRISFAFMLISNIFSTFIIMIIIIFFFPIFISFFFFIFYSFFIQRFLILRLSLSPKDATQFPECLEMVVRRLLQMFFTFFFLLKTLNFFFLHFENIYTFPSHLQYSRI